MKKLVTAEQLAKELAVGVDTVTEWGRSGKIPRIHISRKIIRFDRDAVLSALAGIDKAVALDNRIKGLNDRR